MDVDKNLDSNSDVSSNPIIKKVKEILIIGNIDVVTMPKVYKPPLIIDSSVKKCTKID